MGHHVAKFGRAVCMCLAVASNTAETADCGSKVEDAFQRLKTSGRPYRIETETDQPGNVSIFEVVPPDRMRLKHRIKEGDDWFELVRVGNRVWLQEDALPSDTVGVFDDHMKRLGRPFGAFECLGPVKFSGKTYTGYRTYHLEFLVQPGQQHTERRYWRTVLVDRKTGSLAYEIASPDKHLDKLKSRKHYTYPDRIIIDPPVQ